MIRVIVAGVTGWVGKPLAEAIMGSPDLQLVAAVARTARGQRLGNITISDSVDEALTVPAEVFVDYTSAAAVRVHVFAAIERRLHVVIGSSGLTEKELAEIDRRATAAGVGQTSSSTHSM